MAREVRVVGALYKGHIRKSSLPLLGFYSAGFRLSSVESK
jgi:hypothetical protein